MNEKTRTLLTRTLRVFAVWSAGKISIDDIEAAMDTLGSDITDALKGDVPKVPTEIDVPQVSAIVDAIDRMTEMQERQYKDIIAGRELGREQQRAAIEYYRNQNCRDEERVIQLRKEWAERDERTNTPPAETWFNVDGEICRFRAVLDRDSYLVVAEDGTHHRIPIEGAKECSAPSEKESK